MLFLNSKSTKLIIPFKYVSVPTRTMFRPIYGNQYKLLNKTLSVNYSTHKAMKFKPKKDAAKDLATDDSGMHTHRMNIKCEDNDCDKKKCVTICGKLKSMETDGFFTHKPIPGKYCRHISDKDANNKEDSQYFVQNKDKTKQVDAKKLTSYKNNEIKNDSKFDTFMQNNNDKFHD